MSANTIGKYGIAGVLVWVGLLAPSCVSTSLKLVSTDAVPVYGTDPLYHTVYTGSDEKYHYFARNSGLRGGQVKVARDQLKLSQEYNRGTGTLFVQRIADGKLDVIILKKPGAQPD